MQKQEINLFIDHVHFRLDKEQNRLFEVGRPENTISIDALKDEGNYYTCLFNRETSNLFSGMVSAIVDLENIAAVTIPKSAFDGDTGIYGAINFESQVRLWNIFLADENVMQRLQGKLPVIEIDGENYIIDLRLRELRHSKNPHIRIQLEDLEPVGDGTQYRGLYNTNTKLVTVLLKGNENPYDLTYVQIPYETILDPVSEARRHGLKDTELIMVHPRNDKLKAEIIPLDERRKVHLKVHLEKLQQANRKNEKQRKGKRL